MGSSLKFTWNDWMNDLKKEEDFFDVTLAIDEANQFQAHKVLLSAASPFFRALLKRNPSQHPSIIMPSNVRSMDLQRIIDFIYQGEVNVPENELDYFLRVGATLKIRGLDGVPIEDFTPSGAGGGGGEEMSGKKEIRQPQMGPGTGPRKRPGPPTSQPPKQNPQTKRARGMMGGQMMSPPKFGGPQPMPHSNVQNPPEHDDEVGSQGLDQDVVDANTVDEDSTDIYYDEETYDENQEYSMQDTPPQSSAAGLPGPAGFSQPVLTRVICPKCRGKFTVEDLKVHMPSCQGLPANAEQSQPGSRKQKTDPGEKTDICQFCDKAFKGRTNLKAHIRRSHRMPDGSLPAVAESAAPADHMQQEYPGMDEHYGHGGAMMDPDLQSHPVLSAAPGKKKGRPKKIDQLQQSRPIGQVTPAPRSTGPDMSKPLLHEQPRPPVQQDRGASPMMARQRPTGMMSPSSSNSGPPNKRPGMQPQGIMGPGMRPRGSAPQQFQQGYPTGPMDIKKLGRKLGGAISITSSDNVGGSQPQQAAMRRPSNMQPSTSRNMGGHHHAASSPKNDPLANTGNPGGSRPPSMPPQRAQDPVEVKQEPMDDIYEEDMPEDYEGEEEDFGEEEEDDGEDDQDFGQGSMEGMESGYAPYDDEVEHDNGAGYQQ